MRCHIILLFARCSLARYCNEKCVVDCLVCGSIVDSKHQRDRPALIFHRFFSNPDFRMRYSLLCVLYEVFMRFEDIISVAHKLARPIVTSEECSAGAVAAAIISGLGNTYTGVSMDFECGIGFCAEHAAVAERLKGHESKILMVRAVDYSGRCLPPPCT